MNISHEYEIDIINAYTHTQVNNCMNKCTNEYTNKRLQLDN